MGQFFIYQGDGYVNSIVSEEQYRISSGQAFTQTTGLARVGSNYFITQGNKVYGFTIGTYQTPTVSTVGNIGGQAVSIHGISASGSNIVLLATTHPSSGAKIFLIKATVSGKTLSGHNDSANQENISTSIVEPFTDLADVAHASANDIAVVVNFDNNKTKLYYFSTSDLSQSQVDGENQIEIIHTGANDLTGGEFKVSGEVSELYLTGHWWRYRYRDRSAVFLNGELLETGTVPSRALSEEIAERLPSQEQLSRIPDLDQSTLGYEITETHSFTEYITAAGSYGAAVILHNNRRDVVSNDIRIDRYKSDASYKTGANANYDVVSAWDSGRIRALLLHRFGAGHERSYRFMQIGDDASNPISEDLSVGVGILPNNHTGILRGVGDASNFYLVRQQENDSALEVSVFPYDSTGSAVAFGSRAVNINHYPNWGSPTSSAVDLGITDPGELVNIFIFGSQLYITCKLVRVDPAGCFYHTYSFNFLTPFVRQEVREFNTTFVGLMKDLKVDGRVKYAISDSVFYIYPKDAGHIVLMSQSDYDATLNTDFANLSRVIVGITGT